MFDFFDYLLLYNYWNGDTMREKISKLILVFGVSLFNDSLEIALILSLKL